MESQNVEGYPVIFLHGNGFSKEVFKRQFASPHLKHLRLIALDMPGHGKSSDAIDPQHSYTFSGFADEVLDFINHKKIEKCVVAGWSLGGQVALELIDSSPCIEGVFAFGAPPAPAGSLGLMRSMKLSRSLLLAGKSKFSEADAHHFEKMSFGELADGSFIKDMLRTDPEMRPTLSKSLLRPKGISQQERFSNSSTPVCLLHGAKDPLVKTAYMQSLSSPMLFGGKTAILEDAGHAPFMETQTEFDLLLSFFCKWVLTSNINDVVKAGQQSSLAA
ncbi:MAG: alpha/beta hydrolase [Pseudomonadota bacterium]